MVPVKINPETSQPGAVVARKYGVQGFPTILFIDSGGRKIHEIPGYEPPAEFAKDMQAALKKARGR